MNNYVINPSLLTVEDGKKYISVTFTDSAWITDFEVDFNGNYITPEVVSEDKEANTRIVKFEVEDLFEKLNAKVSLDISAYNYKETHDVQFAFDTDSIKLLKDGENPPTGNDKNPPIVKDKDKDGEGLDFDRDADANALGKKTIEKGKNPKTGDTTQTLLFALLLVGSLIPLVMKYRKRRLPA